MDYFPRCSICGKHSPFLCDENVLQSEHIRKSFKSMTKNQQFAMCPLCLPKSKEFLTPGSFLRNEEFQELLLEYEALKLDAFQALDVAEVIIITREARIDMRFKKLLRKPFPKAVRLRKLFHAFPHVHRLPFLNYGCEAEWLRVLNEKCNQISNFYLNARALDLHDNFDLMVERTPLHERTSNRSQGKSFAEDSLVMRLPVSQPETRNVSMSSVRSSARNRTNSQLDPAADAVSSQSLNISSQSVGPDSIPLPSSESITNISAVSYSQSSSEGSVISMLPNNARNVRTTAAPDSPQPGPSGLQQPTFTVPTRRRRPEPVNPSPENFRDVRVEGGRLPRLPGG